MDNLRVRRASSGFVAPSLMFILATIGITAGATVAIVEAYQKWIIDPPKPSEVRRLSDENNALKTKMHELEKSVKQSDDKLLQEEIKEAAQVLRLTTEKHADNDPHNIGKKFDSRGPRYPLTSEETELIDRKEAVLLVDEALKQKQSPLNSVFGDSKIAAWRRDILPTYKSKLDDRIEAYKHEQPKRRGIIDARIEDAVHAMRAEADRR